MNHSFLAPDVRANYAASEHASVSFSQFGEDLVLQSVFEIRGRLRQRGFYVDVGAHHPTLASNTALLHRIFGWSGINIEPNADQLALFSTERPSDINLCCAIAEQPGVIPYYQFNHPGLNSTNQDWIERTEKNAAFKFIRQDDVEARRIDRVFAEYASSTEIDLLNIDVESAEMSVLRSNDWSKYRPFVISIEDHTLSMHDPARSHVFRFLSENGYTLCNHVIVTSIYIRN